MSVGVECRIWECRIGLRQLTEHRFVDSVIMAKICVCKAEI